jgi:hypothetical protein
MKETQKKTKKLLDNKYPILSLKELLDRIIDEEENFPADLKSSLVSTRDIAWKTFITENEKSNFSSDLTNLSE